MPLFYFQLYNSSKTVEHSLHFGPWTDQLK
jgi:hypothetical protein